MIKRQGNFSHKQRVDDIDEFISATTLDCPMGRTPQATGKNKSPSRKSWKMPQLLDSICTILGVFYKHAKWNGDCSTLERREMKGLIWKEFLEVTQKPCDPEMVEQTFRLLDTNEDGPVDFNEYLMLIFKVAKACYSHLHPRECLHQEEGEARRAQRGELWGDARDHRQLCEDKREENYNRERRDSDWTRLRPIEGTTRRGEERRDYLPRELGAQLDERSRQTHDPQLRDDRGRDRPSREPQKWEDEFEECPHESEPQADEGNQTWKMIVSIGHEILGRETMLKDAISHVGLSHRKAKKETNIPERPHKDGNMGGKVVAEKLSTKWMRRT
ncbi:repetin-like [Elgaria multicarinata webbii]|uniref:repetin-like n=1 Tax=Elgaria multicarinata webbii TaxID=159646 RepID=UPI002FCD4341